MDAARFTELTDRPVEQFEACVVHDGVHVNGRLTPAERFFPANATLWRANISPALQRTLAGVDPHGPRRLRVIEPVSDLEAFRGRVRARREHRIKIW